MQKITPFLWFDDNAEEAVNIYTSIFKNSKIGTTIRYDEAGAKAAHRPKGSVMTVSFNLAGTNFTAINGGPVFKFTPAISFFVNCKTSDEVQAIWDKLAEGGKPLMPLDKYFFSEKYGWIEDKFGLSWQIILTRENFSQVIIPSFLFVGNVCGKAEEAVNFYTSLFPDSKVGEIFRYGPDQKPDEEGTVAHAAFTLGGQKFVAMDSAHKHEFTFSEAQSFVVNCTTQEEVDHYWNKLSAVPQAEQCGWLKDKFGISWQIIPETLIKLLGDSDPVKSQRVMQAMLQMKKIETSKLQKAYEQ